MLLMFVNVSEDWVVFMKVMVVVVLMVFIVFWCSSYSRWFRLVLVVVCSSCVSWVESRWVWVLCLEVLM